MPAKTAGSTGGHFRGPGGPLAARRPPLPRPRPRPANGCPPHRGRQIALGPQNFRSLKTWCSVGAGLLAASAETGRLLHPAPGTSSYLKQYPSNVVARIDPPPRPGARRGRWKLTPRPKSTKRPSRPYPSANRNEALSETDHGHPSPPVPTRRGRDRPRRAAPGTLRRSSPPGSRSNPSHLPPRPGGRASRDRALSLAGNAARKVGRPVAPRREERSGARRGRAQRARAP